MSRSGSFLASAEDLHFAVVEKPAQFLPLVERVASNLAQSAFGQRLLDQRHTVLMNFYHLRCGMLLTKRQPLGRTHLLLLRLPVN